MPITLKPFNSETGFSSPGFSTDTAGNLDFSGSIRSGGVVLLTPTAISSGITSSNLTSLGTLTGLTVHGNVSVTTGTNFNVTLNSRTLSVTESGSVSMSYAASSIAITPAQKVVIESENVGTIDHVDIGQTTPAKGKFTDLTVTGVFSVGSQAFLTSYPSTQGLIDNYSIGSQLAGPARFTNLTVTGALTLTPGSVGTIDNVTIGENSPGTASFTSATITSLPTQTTQVTNKQYVDSKVTAFAIALGS